MTEVEIVEAVTQRLMGIVTTTKDDANWGTTFYNSDMTKEAWETVDVSAGCYLLHPSMPRISHVFIYKNGLVQGKLS
jgi:hypothetical protein